MRETRTFKSVSPPLAALVALISGLLYWNDRRRGGYRVERIYAADETASEATLVGATGAVP